MCTVEFLTIKLSCNKKNLRNFLNILSWHPPWSILTGWFSLYYCHCFLIWTLVVYVIIRYAREDTHYLLYIYDMLRVQLVSMRTSAESDVDDALLQVPGIALLRCHPALWRKYWQVLRCVLRHYTVCHNLSMNLMLPESWWGWLYNLTGYVHHRTHKFQLLSFWSDVIKHTLIVLSSKNQGNRY